MGGGSKSDIFDAKKQFGGARASIAPLPTHPPPPFPPEYIPAHRVAMLLTGWLSVEQSFFCNTHGRVSRFFDTFLWSAETETQERDFRMQFNEDLLTLLLFGGGAFYTIFAKFREKKKCQWSHNNSTALIKQIFLFNSALVMTNI